MISISNTGEETGDYGEGKKIIENRSPDCVVPG